MFISVFGRSSTALPPSRWLVIAPSYLKIGNRDAYRCDEWVCPCADVSVCVHKSYHYCLPMAANSVNNTHKYQIKNNKKGTFFNEVCNQARVRPVRFVQKKTKTKNIVSLSVRSSRYVAIGTSYEQQKIKCVYLTCDFIFSFWWNRWKKEKKISQISDNDVEWWLNNNICTQWHWTRVVCGLVAATLHNRHTN